MTFFETIEILNPIFHVWWIPEITLTDSTKRTVLYGSHITSLHEGLGFPPHDLIELTRTHAVGD